mmetsp:Transcript_25059/g.39030  ORF Transcript_25059/g.39030 Transcript_25059/m.39030 type:complete len:213 (-) Transcript_25059:6-644(-)
MNISPFVFVVPQEASEHYYKLQRASMLLLFGLDEDMRILRSLKSCGVATRSPQHLQVCEWNGVTCSANKVQKISWVLSRHLYLEWVPGSVTLIAIHFDANRTCLNTRSLPKCLVKLSLPKCRLTGILKLTCLPSRLEILSAPDNFFHGTVSLMALPASIRELDLRMNTFSCVAYSGSLLPESLKSADFRHSKTKRTSPLVMDKKYQKQRVHV